MIFPTDGDPVVAQGCHNVINALYIGAKKKNGDTEYAGRDLWKGNAVSDERN